MTIAIIDDDQRAAQVTRMHIEDAGLEPWIFDGRARSLPNIARDILARAEAAVCDHRLRPLGFAQFDGAALVAHLIAKKLPAVLISQFVNQDYDVSIRHWRAKLPSVLSRDEFRADTLTAGLERCRKEIAGERTPDRRPHRVLFQVADIQNESKQRVVDAIIPSWSRQSAVRFPFDIVPKRLQPCLRKGQYMIAQVNLGANRPEELYFDRFEKVPTPRNALFDHL